jgi:hypothetical protein
MDRRKFISTGLGAAAALSVAPSREAAARRQSAKLEYRNANIAIIDAGLFGCG